MVFNIQGSVSDRILDYLEPISRLRDLMPTATLLSPRLACVVRDYQQVELLASSSYTPTSLKTTLDIVFNQSTSIAIKK